MPADISSSGASENSMTLKIIGNVGRSSAILYRFQLLIFGKKKACFSSFLQDFFFCQVFRNLSDCSWNKVYNDSGKICIPETDERAAIVQDNISIK